MTVLTDTQVAAYAKGAGFTGGDVVISVAVAHAESGCRTDAVNSANTDGTRDYGVWQINSSHAALLASGNWQNPADNARMAYAVFQSQGWRAWSTYNSGAYKIFLPQGFAAAGAAPVTGNVPMPTITPAVSIGGTVSGIGDFVKLFTDPHTYLRVAMLFVGVILLFIGILGFQRVSHAVGMTAKTAAVIA